MSTPESAVVKACLQYLVLKHVMAWRNNTGVARPSRADGSTGFLRFGAVGSSDIIGIMPDGRFLAVECKAKGGKLSEPQRFFLADIRKHGGVAIVVYSVDNLAVALALEGGR